jgi:hypothetical protein
MRNYVDLSIIYPNNVQFNNCTLSKETNKIIASPDIVNFYGVGDFINQFDFQYNLKEKTLGNERYIMDTGPFEMVTNKYFIDNAFGDVLIFGLGVGFIVFPLLNDETVTSITIVDNNQDIIDYIGGVVTQQDINNKVNIVLGDVLDYHNHIQEGTSFDFIYFDYWDKLTIDAYNEMNSVKLLYTNYLRDMDSIIYCWCQDIQNLIVLE